MVKNFYIHSGQRQARSRPCQGQDRPIDLSERKTLTGCGGVEQSGFERGAPTAGIDKDGDRSDKTGNHRVFKCFHAGFIFEELFEHV